MITVSLFGTTKGLEVKHISIGEVSSLSIENTWLDLSENDVRLKSDSDVFRIYRRRASGKVLTWVGVYRSATAIGVDRAGGFYGAGVWLIGSVISSSAIFEVVIKLADQIRDLAIKDGKFIKKIADIWETVVPPPEVKTLLTDRASVTSRGLDPDKGRSAFITNTEDVVAVIDWAQRGVSADFFHHVLIGASDQFVAQNGPYIKGFEKFDSIHSAADHAYDQRRQQWIADSESLLTEHKREVGKIKVASEAAQLQLRQILGKEFDDKLAPKDTQIKELQAQINKLQAHNLPERSGTPRHETFSPAKKTYKPGTDQEVELPKESGLHDFYDADQPKGVSIGELLIVVAIITILIAFVYWLFTPYSCWHVWSCSQKAATQQSHRALPPESSDAAYKNVAVLQNRNDTQTSGVSGQPADRPSPTPRESQNSILGDGQNSVAIDVLVPAKPVESNCRFDWKDFKSTRYNITSLNTDKGASRVQSRTEVYKEIERICDMPRYSRPCESDMSDNKNIFIKGTTPEGEILLPRACVASISEIRTGQVIFKLLK